MNTEQRAEGEGRRGQSLELVKRRGLAERVGRMLKGRERCAREDAEEAERLKAEEIKRAKHAAWRKCQIALCAEVGAPGNPRARDLERWIGRMAGVNAMGFAALQDIKEMARGLHLDQARAMLRLALATGVVALYAEDEEVVKEQSLVLGPSSEEGIKGTEETRGTGGGSTSPLPSPQSGEGVGKGKE